MLEIMEKKINTLTPTKIHRDDPAYSTVKELDNVLNQAVEKNIRNIAITGPFGSGKSSVLKTLMSDFDKENRTYLSISLATLKPNEDISKTDGESNQLDLLENEDNLNRKIEYSILQQLIYKEKAETLPNSRFRKITHYSKRQVLKFAIAYLVTLISYLIVFEPEFARVDTIYNVFNRGIQFNTLFDSAGALWLLYVLFYLSQFIIRKYSNLKLNKFNLKNGEIELQEENSIFNKHLDEILYFFQATDYNVVLIEDLDRFETSKIFIKLRELCNLINESKIVGRHITFIYAIKDDVFKDEERTKFFDYITTVIPIINPSNSKDKLKAALIENGLHEGEILDDDLSEIAFFIQDMRILKNIVNEYFQYRTKLYINNSQLNATKLLAMVVYKNYFPKDFALLHKCEGKVYTCISKKRDFVSVASQYITESFKILEKEINQYKENCHLKQTELRMLFLLKLTKLISQNLRGLYINGQVYNLEEIANDPNLFDTLLNLKQIKYQYSNYYNQTVTDTINLNSSDIESDFNYLSRSKILGEHPGIFNERKEKLIASQKLIKSQRLSTLLTEYGCGKSEIYQNIKLDPMQDIFLRRGYIDEEYYDYISYFYEGTITQTDREFLLKLKQDIALSFDYHIDKIQNVVNELKPYMFKTNAILNIELLDYISVNNKELYSHFMDILLSVDNDKLSFLSQYYQYGYNSMPVFEYIIKENRDNFWNYIISYNNNTEKEYLIESYLKYCGELTPIEQDWVNRNFCFLVNHNSGIELDRNLKIVATSKFVTINTENSSLFDCLIEYSSYVLNSVNLALIIKELTKGYEHIADGGLNYTCILSTRNEYLISYVNDNLNIAIDCFEFSTKKESAEGILIILNSDSINIEKKEKYLFGQHNKIKSFGDIHDDMCRNALNWDLIQLSWANILWYYKHKSGISEELINYTRRNVTELSQLKCNLDFPDEYNLFSEFIGTEILDNDTYFKLIDCFSCTFKDNHLEIADLSVPKLKLLIEKNKLHFNEEMLAIINETDVLAEYLIYHSTEFLTHLNYTYNLNANSVETLLNFSFSSNDICRILSIVPRDVLLNTKNIADKSIISLLKHTIELDEAVILYFIKNAINKELALKYAINVIRNYSFEENQISTILCSLKDDYAEIANKSRRPRIKVSALNTELLYLLQERRYISSFKDENNDYYRIYHSKSE